jgi:phospholipid/cholesterol/gamma-HCH transport system substrate-binding protein
VKDTRRNYAIVGAFVLAIGAALLGWIALLSGRAGASDPYYIVYDSVMGLAPGLQILYQGYPVGLIDEIELVEDSGRPRYRVDVSVRRGVRIPADSRAVITAPGLLSAVVIDIKVGSAPGMLPPGSEIPGVEAANVIAAVTGVVDQVGPLLASATEDVPAILANLERFSADLNETVTRMNALLAPENSGRVERTLSNLEGLSVNAEGVTRDLRESVTRLDGLLGSAQGVVDENRDDLTLAVGDAQQVLESLARHMEAISHNLEVATRNLNEFSRELRENPAVLLRNREAGDGAPAPEAP